MRSVSALKVCFNVIPLIVNRAYSDISGRTGKIKDFYRELQCSTRFGSWCSEIERIHTGKQMMKHVNKTAKFSFYQIPRSKTARRIPGQDISACLVTTYIISRLDYCNSVLTSFPKSTTAPLQRIQNTAARVVK